MQATRLNRLSGQLLNSLSQWAENPWRRFSLLLLVLLAGFSAGVSIGSVAGVLMVIDPVGALVVVAASELAIKARRPCSSAAATNCRWACWTWPAWESFMGCCSKASSRAFNPCFAANIEQRPYLVEVDRC